MSGFERNQASSNKKRKFSSSGMPPKPSGVSRQVTQARTTISSKAFTQRVNALIKGKKEIKSSSASTTELAVTTGVTPAYFSWPEIGVGPEVNERIGNEITIDRIEMKVLYHNNGTGSAGRPVAREILMLVSGGRYITDGEITSNLFEGSVSAAPSGTTQDLLRALNTDGIRILSDRLVKMAPLTADSHNVVQYSHVTKVMNKKMLYRDSGTAQPVHDRYVLCIMPVDPGNDGALHTFEVSTNLRFYYHE